MTEAVDQVSHGLAAGNTLTSLAMLKVSIDRGHDYLDYLRPFVLQALIDHRPERVTDEAVRSALRSDYGLEIPARAVQVVLKRLSRTNPITKSQGVYEITGPLPHPDIAGKKAKADQHIEDVINGLIEFAADHRDIIATPDDAIAAICGFLSEFNIPCLKAFLRGTAIPAVDPERQQVRTVLVSQYVLDLQQNDERRFEGFLVLVQGHMLANALLCPDLQQAPKTYKGVSFYLDTPLLVRRLGLEGDYKQRAVEELLALLRNLGATVACFDHSQDELERVLKGAADHVEKPTGRGAIVMEARRKGLTRSDLLLHANQVEQMLRDASIEIVRTPQHVAEFQIDEAAFESVLEDEVSYLNPRAKDFDTKSVRSIYVLRNGRSPSSIERAKAVLVTSNAGFARAAYDYGKKHEETREVSSVITDFSLANMAWLKAPLGAPALPTAEVLAFAYAAMRPSKEFLDRCLAEIEKLQSDGRISERDHQLLRSNVLAQDELMRLTLGDEAALTEETVSETVRRVSTEIKQEETERLREEKSAHTDTREQLEAARTERHALQQRLYWGCRRKAAAYATAITVLIALLLFAGVLAGLGLTTQSRLAGWILFAASLVLAVATLANLMFGATVRGWHEAVRKRILMRLLAKETTATGIEFHELTE